MKDVQIKDEGIRLGQFLKLVDAVETGADVKELLADEVVLVNEEVETRRGRQLFPGDIVEIGDQAFRVVDEALLKSSRR